MKRIVVIGAGIGGLTAAAVLARQGYQVTVLEAHVYPGGCAGTFYHQGYRFDAGATLSGGFYPGGPMDLVAQAAGIADWPAHPAHPAMVVHLPDGTPVARWPDDRRQEAYQAAFGNQAGEFWRWQERTADALWDLALRTPAWPPQALSQTTRLLLDGISWLKDDGFSRLNPQLMADATRPLAHHLRGLPDSLRLFIDAQLLISAQTISSYANALYGAAALDLPRRGAAHLEGGMGAIADTLVQAVRNNGGSVYFRKQVARILMEHGRPVAVETKRGESIPADAVIANLSPWNIRRLMKEEHTPRRLLSLPEQPQDGWGAFMLYVGVDGNSIPADLPLHHQVILREPLGEGNTAFVSISPAWDAGRAPQGQRAMTISTHTRFQEWWRLYDQDRAAYEDRKEKYIARLLEATARVIPDIRQSASLMLPATPVTFERFTKRASGWVGGFPQTSLFRLWGPRLARGLWMVGDSIFPGQSTAAVALGGLRVAADISRPAAAASTRPAKSASLIRYNQQV